LEKLAHELLEVIGSRLVGTPQMQKAHDWAVDKYASWGITARNEQWGKWRGWERGVTHIDLLAPRVRTLEGTMLAWSPGTPKNGLQAGTIILPEVADSVAFKNWLPKVKGKFVLISMLQSTGRPDKDWEEFATKESFEKRIGLSSHRKWPSSDYSSRGRAKFLDEMPAYNTIGEMRGGAKGDEYVIAFGAFRFVGRLVRRDR
jgi:hypothetical protein